MPKNKYKINEHNIYRHKRKNETEDEYAKRSANDLEKKIEYWTRKNLWFYR